MEKIKLEKSENAKGFENKNFEKCAKSQEQLVSRTSIYLSRPKKYITREKTLGD